MPHKRINNTIINDVYLNVFIGCQSRLERIRQIRKRKLTHSALNLDGVGLACLHSAMSSRLMGRIPVSLIMAR